jgi:TolA protein
MTATDRPLHARPRSEGELAWVGVSALVHAAGIAALALLPTQLPGPRPIESYTVDLVAPSAVGGTNLVPGRPKDAAKKPVAPSRPKVEPLPGEVRLPEPKPPVAEQEETKVRAPEVAVKPLEEKPKPPVVPPKQEVEKPKNEAVAKAPEPPKPEPKPAQPEVKQSAAVAPAAKPAVPAKEPPKAEKPPQARPAPKADSPPAVQPKPKEPAKVEKAAAEKPAAAPQPKADGTSQVDRRIAEAVERRAKQLQGSAAEAPPSGEIDRRIAAAVERKARGLQGSGAEGGGPISYGPGEGSGGVVRGVDYILYRGHMEDRIKAAWAWAGANRSLRAVVRFNILANGDIVNVQIVTASGDPSYDSSIERALRAASPLNPPPDQYREEFSTVELEFRPEDLQS